MNLIISLAAAGGFILLTAGSMKKYSSAYYAAATAGACLITVVTWSGIYQSFPSWCRYFLWPLFSQAGFSTALFVYIMYAGALSHMSTMRKIVLRNRGRLSIIASILTLGHNVAYGRTYFTALFFHPLKLRENVLDAALCSIIMIPIMVPLFVASFENVRKKISAAAWKRIQRWAYLFYALIYVHVMLLMVPSAWRGSPKYLVNVILYSFVFLGYFYLRLRKALRKNQMIAAPGLFSAVPSLMVFLIVSLPGIFSGYVESAASIPAAVSEETEAQLVTEADFSVRYKVGSYTGSAGGYSGPIKLKILVNEGKLSDIQIVQTSDDKEYMDMAKNVIRLILERNTAEGIDSVSGATVSSEGILKAAEAALKKAENH